MRFILTLTSVFAFASIAPAGELTVNQRLVVASHHIDVDGVVAALRDGGDVNGRFGDGDIKLFTDPWSLGWPVAAKRWTPLIALASASAYPNPPRQVENTGEDLDWAREQQKKVPSAQLEQRRRDGLTILFILLSHRADLDADDGVGATALYTAVYEEKVEIAKVLLRFGAKVNTKTRIYIDGPGDTTPLHYACRSAELTKLLLEKGADPKAKDSTGETPLDWAKRYGDQAVVRLYPSP